ncbi:MAG: glycosyltransferase [Promethearchaeota archaeon]
MTIIMEDLKKESVSLIIPAWNEEKIIKNTLKFLARIKLPFNYSELIIIAGGDDNTFKTCQAFKVNNFKNIIVLKQEPGDFKSGALKKGIKKSKGNIIILMDADVLISPNLAIEVSKALKKFDVVNCNFIPLLPKGLWFNYYEIFKRIWVKDPNNLSSLVGGATISFRREIIEEIGVENCFSSKTTAGVDYYMGQIFKKYKKRMGFVKKAKILMPRPNNVKDFSRDRFRWIKAFLLLHSKDKKLIVISFFFSMMYCLFPPLLMVWIFKNITQLTNLEPPKIKKIVSYFLVEYLIHLLRVIASIRFYSRSLKPIGHFKGTDRYNF